MADRSPLHLVSETRITEWEARVELAACYRIFDLLGWTHGIFNHITAKVPGPKDHFLINPFGLLYGDVTASNLVKIDLQGNIVGDSEFPVNTAGFVIHSAIHGARPDVHCIMHTHSTAGQAVSCLESGLTRTNFYAAMLDGQVTYHDFEGLTTRPDECDRLVASLGDKDFMILRSHGLLTCGRTVPEAFLNLWHLEHACAVQVAAASAVVSGGGILPISDEAAGYSTTRRGDADLGKVDPNSTAPSDVAGLGAKLFAAYLRKIEALDPSYRN